MIESYISFLKLDKNLCVKIINIFGFYLGVIDVINVFKILLYEFKKGVLIKDIKEKIKKLYNIFGFVNNSDILEVELDKLEKIDKNIILNGY